MTGPARMILAVTAATAITAVATIGILTAAGPLSTNAAPAAIGDACRTFVAAYNDAAGEAKRENDATLQTQLAHPIRVADVWKAKHQAALEAAALKVQNLTGDWGNVAWQLVQAASVMQPTNLDDGLAQKDNALSAAQAACVGR
ncbi:hypothetical protein JOL79_11385 [Microbispora sp. RL4-1S]|uniref:Uncharacterized protein n=1 Tax=Microbispora oryzae TaxID=2806554 RepID=A0A940WFA1_9ACTN|nr:hypothetical protein [Microbispora oryzae]MBP2704416.1 hypothetical protein [Microbispora oryzae]